jgi:hypothetical protein
LASKRDVAAAFAQRRHHDLDDLEPVVQVGMRNPPASTSAGSGRLLAAMRRTLACRGVGVAHAVVGAVLQDVRSSLAWNAADALLTSSRNSVPLVRDLEEARLGALGAGEGAALVTEELAFDDRSRGWPRSSGPRSGFSRRWLIRWI